MGNFMPSLSAGQPPGSREPSNHTVKGWLPCQRSKFHWTARNSGDSILIDSKTSVVATRREEEVWASMRSISGWDERLGGRRQSFHFKRCPSFSLPVPLFASNICPFGGHTLAFNHFSTIIRHFIFKAKALFSAAPTFIASMVTQPQPRLHLTLRKFQLTFWPSPFYS